MIFSIHFYIQSDASDEGRSISELPKPVRFICGCSNDEELMPFTIITDQSNLK